MPESSGKANRNRSNILTTHGQARSATSASQNRKKRDARGFIGCFFRPRASATNTNTLENGRARGPSPNRRHRALPHLSQLIRRNGGNANGPQVRNLRIPLRRKVGQAGGNGDGEKFGLQPRSGKRRAFGRITTELVDGCESGAGSSHDPGSKSPPPLGRRAKREIARIAFSTKSSQQSLPRGPFGFSDGPSMPMKRIADAVTFVRSFLFPQRDHLP